MTFSIVCMARVSHEVNDFVLEFIIRLKKLKPFSGIQPWIGLDGFVATIPLYSDTVGVIVLTKHATIVLVNN